MSERHAIVVGSQCISLPSQPLTFLPGRASDLFDVLVDPDLGACDPAASTLLIDPTTSEMVAAVQRSVASASESDAALLVALIGHGHVPEFGPADQLFFLTKDASVPPTSHAGYHIAQNLIDSLRLDGSAGVTGVLLIIDTCYGGVGAAEVMNGLQTIAASADISLEIAGATFDQVAIDGCFSNSLVELLRSGHQAPIEHFSVRDTSNWAAQICTAQEEPVHLAFARGRLLPMGDPGLWIAKNKKYNQQPGGLLGGMQELAISSTFYAPTTALEDVVEAADSGGCVLIVGTSGSGKTTLFSALAAPEKAPGIIPQSFLNAAAFCSKSSTVETLCDVLVAQLSNSHSFLLSSASYQDARSETEYALESTFLARVLGPLLDSVEQDPATPPVRIAIDAVNLLAPSDLTEVLSTVIDNQARLNDSSLTVILSTTAEADLVTNFPALRVVYSRDPTSDEIAVYLRSRGLPSKLVAAVTEAMGQCSWMQLSLLADELLRREAAALRAVRSLDEMYELMLADLTSNDALAKAAVEVMAVGTKSASVPSDIARRAVEVVLEQSVTLAAWRSVLAKCGSLIVRRSAGTEGEQIGLLHDSLSAFLIASMDEATVHSAFLATASIGAEPGLARDYWEVSLIEHLWGAGAYHEALAAVRESLTQRPGDNLPKLRRWITRAGSVLGEFDTEMIELQTAVANQYGMAGAVDMAVTELSELLERLSAEYGAHDEMTFSTRYSISHWLIELGHFEEAMHWLKALLRDQTVFYDPKSGEVLVTKFAIATARLGVGDSGARDDLVELIAEFPEGSEDNLNGLRWLSAAKNNEAYARAQSGDLKGALSTFRELLGDQLELGLSASDRDVMLTRNNIAQMYQDLGQLDLSLAENRLLVADRTDALGERDPDTLVSLNNLAASYFLLGHFGTARQQFWTLYQTKLEVFGPRRQSTHYTLENLISCINKDRTTAVTELRALRSAISELPLSASCCLEFVDAAQSKGLDSGILQ
ncbi:tetratricopeptide repeat protein [Nakamurella deserti]|uniref:tetratricopeptide repeat protein n=1 Tax=Nakamurella deserti TaxID=2164074 RepID=UPI0013002C97|nr:tetratricopeptide repeat protein [Nakamurella deserti]